MPSSSQKTLLKCPQPRSTAQQSAITVRILIYNILYPTYSSLHCISANLVSGSIQATSEQVLVPDAMVGLIIGRGGEQISRLQGESKCKIQMDQESHDQIHR